MFYVSPNAERLSDGRKRAWVSERMGNRPNVLSSVQEQHELEILQNSGKLTIHKGRSLRAEEFEAQNMLARKREWREEGVCGPRRDSLRGKLEALAWYRWKVSENRDVVI